MRTCLSADAVYSVPTDFSTPQLAYDSIRDTVDVAGKKVNLNIADGAYGPLTLDGRLTGLASDKDFTITGNVAHPNQVTISGGVGDGITVKGGACARIEGITASGDRGLIVYQHSRVTLGVMGWGACTEAAMASEEDAHIQLWPQPGAGQYLLGQFPIFAIAEAGGKIWLNGQTISAMVANVFSDAFVHTSQHGLIDLSGTILNTAFGTFSGPAYIAESGSLVIWLGMLPQGLSAGTNNQSVVIP